MLCRVAEPAVSVCCAVSCHVISRSAVFKFVTFQIILYFVTVHAVLSFSVPAVCAVFAMMVIVLMVIGT